MPLAPVVCSNHSHSRSCVCLSARLPYPFHAAFSCLAVFSCISTFSSSFCTPFSPRSRSPKLHLRCQCCPPPYSIVDLVRRLELGSGYATDLRHAHSQVRPDSAALDPLDREDGRTGGGWCAPVRTSSCCAPPLPQGFAPLRPRPHRARNVDVGSTTRGAPST